MNNIAKVISSMALGLVIVPCVMHWMGVAELETVKLAALIGTIGWFAATPIWMSRELPVDAGEVEI